MIRNDIIRDEGIVYVGQWEPIYFVKQSGRNAENLQSSYDFQRSEAYVEHLASMGVNHMWGNFFKGYGLAFEDAEQQRLPEFIEACHARGVRYMAYITFGTLVMETMLAEEPGAEDWIAQPTDVYRAAYSGYQNFRARVDYTCDEYLDYITRVVDKALDMGADGIHFDNTEMAIGKEACRCKRCEAKFRAWLDERYGDHTDETRRAGQIRYHTNDFSRANMPWWTDSQHIVQQRAVRVPHQQDNVQFRCDVFAAAIKRLADHIRGRGRLAESNVGKPDNCNNQYYRGLDYERTYPLLDVSFHEGMSKTAINRHGTPIAPVREFRIAQSFRLPLMVYCRNLIEQAMAFAFNPGMVGTVAAGQDAKRQAMFDFFRKYRKYNTHAETLANVAVLRHRLSLAFDSYTPYLAACAVEQVLQEDHIPYGILAAGQLDRLEDYRLLIIPAMQHMTGAEIERISEWVRAGGRLLLIGDVAIYDELNQLRTAVKEVRTIEDFIGRQEVEPGFAGLAGRKMDAAFAVDAGAGRVAFIPALAHVGIPGNTTADWTVESDHINPPKNADEVLAAVRDLLAGAEPIRVEGSRELVVDLCRRTDTGEGVVHLVNVGHLAGRSASATVTVRWDAPVKSIRCLRYDADEAVVNSFSIDGDDFSFVIEDIREHAVVVIEPK